MAYTLVKRDSLPQDVGTFEFQGIHHGGDVSFIWVDMAPGEGVRLHSHPYQEIFIVIEGTATYRVGTDTVEASAGDIIVTPPDEPHAFVNSGSGRLLQIDIHLSRDYRTTWLE